jgi:hypothetical protein
MKEAVMMIVGTVMVAISLTVLENNLDLQMPMLIFGALLAAAGLLLDEDRRHD